MQKRILGGALAAAILLAGGSVAFVKHKDNDNRFCISCHLHEDLYRRTIAPTPGTLAGGHFRARHAAHPERCFTCHSGEGVAGWTTVTAYSAYDAARWVLGDRHEPDSMRVKLENTACTKCHGRLGHGLHTDSGRFHDLAEHRSIPTRCVDCHTVHSAGPRERIFMNPAVVQAQCVKCHPGGPAGSEGSD